MTRGLGVLIASSKSFSQASGSEKSMIMSLDAINACISDVTRTEGSMAKFKEFLT